MTDDDELRRWVREGEAALERIRSQQAGILAMVRGLLAALQTYRTRESFDAWLRRSAYGDLDEADMEALYKIGEHYEMAEKFLRTTVLVEPQEIWNALKQRVERAAR